MHTNVYSHFKKQTTRKLFFYFLVIVFLISIFILSVSLLSGDSPDLITSDGNGYYAWLRSIAIDRDINFENDFKLLYFPDHFAIDTKTPKGLTPNKYFVGVAILEIPGFLIGHIVAHLTSFNTDGVSLPYQLSITLSLSIVTIVSFYCFFISLEKQGITPGVNFLISSTALIGTNLIHYVAKEPSMSHAIGVALINYCIFMAVYKPGFTKYPVTSRLFTGVLMGLVLIIRPTNIFFLPFLIYLFRSEIRSVRSLVSFTVGISAMIFIQQASQFMLWGHWIVNSYGDEGFRAGIVGLFSILFGGKYGVFLYHPWYFFLLSCNIVGLAELNSKRPLIFTILISVVCLWLVNGWWGFSGDSFGSRAFIEVLPPLSFGAAYTLNSRSIIKNRFIQIGLRGFVVIIILLNFYLWGGYLLTQYPHDQERTLIQVYNWLPHYLLGGSK